MSFDNFYLLPLVLSVGYPVYDIRRDFLTFTFLSIFYFLFIVIPFYVICIDYQTAAYAYSLIDISAIFIICFYLTYKIFLLGYRLNTVKLFFPEDGVNINILYKYAYFPLIIGVFLKILGGDLIHSSIFTIPWQNPILFGVSDRIFYLGVMITALCINNEGINHKNFFSSILIIMLSILGGSRIILLLPVSFLILLICSRGGFFNLVKVGLFGALLLISIVFLIGTYRIDPSDRLYSLYDIQDLFLFRISEFYWPALLIEKIQNGEIDNNIYWAFSGLLGCIPAFISEYFLGISIFARDTDLMSVAGIAQPYMSVPLTPLGEGYYWLGLPGVVIISVIFSMGFVFIGKMGLHLKKMTLLLLNLQLYRSVFVLPVAAYPEFISFITKDILIDYIIVTVFWRLLVLFNSKLISKHGQFLR